MEQVPPCSSSMWRFWLCYRYSYRRFDFGTIFMLHMLDTRIEGSDREYDDYRDADGGFAHYLADLIPNAAGIRPDASCQMMSSEQQNWLTTGLGASNATWQMLGSQTLMVRLQFSVSVTSTFRTNPAALTPAQTGLPNQRSIRCCFLAWIHGMATLPGLTASQFFQGHVFSARLVWL